MVDQLEFHFLGPILIRRNGSDLLDELPLKGQALLAYLAVTGIQHSRASLAGLLWGEMPEQTARTNLRLTLSRMRKVIGDSIAISHHSVGLFNDFWLDIRALEALTPAASCPLPQLQTALTLIRNDFLAGFFVPDSSEFELWMLTTRAHLRQLGMEILLMLTCRARQYGDLETALAAARRLLALEPWHEEAHQELMWLLAATGQRSAALAQFEICRHLLEDELDAEPADATIALFESIRAGEFGSQRSNSALQLESAPHEGRIPAPRHNLPGQLTPMIGREREKALLIDQISQGEYRLLSLVGEGGVGKTRLAIAVATATLDQFADGTWFVPLAAERSQTECDVLAQENAVATAIAATLGLNFSSKEEPRHELLTYLAQRRCLLVLDNCEALIGAGGLLSDLLMAAPGVTCLVTSREPFRLRFEYVFRLEGLAVPPEPSTADTTYSSLQLFIECAERSGSRELLTPAYLADAGRICQFVNGLPLGIELTAGWTRWLAPSEIWQTLHAHDGVLELALPELPPRHRSMQAVFEYSWQLLSDAEQKALAQFAVFVGTFRLEAARAVVGMLPTVLFSLVDKSLVQRTANGAFLIHDLLRTFAYQKLRTLLLDQESLRDRHAVYYLDFMNSRTEPIQGADPRRVIEEIQTQADNVSQAWDWATSRPLPEALASGLMALTTFWWVVGLLHTGSRNLGRTIDRITSICASSATTQPSLSLLLARLYAAHSSFLIDLGQLDKALDAARQATALAAAESEVEVQAMGYLQQGNALFYLGDLASAHRKLNCATALLGDNAPIRLSGSIQRTLAAIVWRQGDLKQATYHAEEALQYFHRLEDVRGEARCHYLLGIIALNQQHLAGAEAMMAQALQRAELCVDRQLMMAIHGVQGQIASYQGRFDQALHFYELERDLAEETGNAVQIGVNASNVGDMKLAMAEYKGAAIAYDEALTIFQSLGMDQPISNVLSFYGLLHCQTGSFLRGEQMCREAVALAKAAKAQREEAFAWLFLGHNCAAQQRWEEASKAYDKAWRLWQALGDSRRELESLAGQAGVLLATGCLAEARAQVRPILGHLLSGTVDGATDPSRVYLTCYQVLQATGDSQATLILQRACELIQNRAAHIQDETRRKAFLEDVPVHRELMWYRKRSS